MQVIVRRSDLSNPNPIALATYDDTVVVDVTAYGLGQAGGHGDHVAARRAHLSGARAADAGDQLAR